MKFLVVDDESSNREMIADFLETIFSGPEVITAANGQEALTKLNEFSSDSLPGVVFIDFEMPGMNGLELMETVARHPILKYLPFIMISGYSDNSALSRKVNALGGRFLSKPISLEGFRAIVLEALGH